MVYTDFHRHMLQTFTREFALTQPEANKEYHEYCRSNNLNAEEAPPSLDAVAREINDRLHKYQMQLTIMKRKADEIDGKIYWTLVNRGGNDKISETATVHKEWVMPWFKKVLKFVVRNNKGYVTTTEAIHLAQGMKGTRRIKGAEVEAKLRDLTLEKWLHETDRTGYYTAGLRSLVELESLMVEYGAYVCPVTEKPVISTKRYRTWLKEKGYTLPPRDFPDDAIDPHADEEEDDEEKADAPEDE